MGSVDAYSTGAGTRYRARYRTPDKVQREKKGFRSKTAAREFLTTVEASKLRGEFIDTAAGRQTVGELGARWLSGLPQLKPSSRATVETAWRVHVEPRWGSVQVGKVRHSDIQAWVSGMTLGASSVIRNHNVLSQILDVAEADRLIQANPARKIKLPRKVPRKRSYLTHAQVEKLAGLTDEHGTLVRFLAYTGLRWGEATALRVRDMDFLRRRAAVSENAVRVGGQIVVGTPKTHHARSVPWPEFLSTELARLCEGKARDALVFGNGLSHLRQATSGTGWFAVTLRRAQAAERDFPTITVHDLRHTAASLAIAAGANVKAVQRMLGHASAAMTLDVYADLFDDDLDAVAVQLDAARRSVV